MADNEDKKPTPTKKFSESANDSAVKAELDKIVWSEAKAQSPAPFLRSFSLGNPADWTTPAVDFNRQFNQDGEVEPVPSIPAFGFVRAMDHDSDEPSTDKHVAFGDDKNDGIRKNQTFAGSLSDVIGHSDETYPHYHHVISRHRPSRTRKVIDKTEAKLSTHHESENEKGGHDNVAYEESEQDKSEKKDEEKPVSKKPLFSVGQGPSETETDHEEHEKAEKKTQAKKKKSKHRHHHHKAHFTQDELELRRTKGSELAMEDIDAIKKMGDSSDEDLDGRDREDLYHQRFDHMAGIERHKIEPRRKKSSHTIISGPAKAKDQQKLMEVMFPEKSFDHTPHNVFVEMDELIDNSWVEQGRWIKYEEAREEGSERWGKPHVSSLSFHSLLNLRIHLERGVILLDHEARDMTNLLFTIVEEFNLVGLLDDDLKSEVLRILLFRHRYVDGEHHGHHSIVGGMRRNLSWKHLSKDNSKAASVADIRTLEEGGKPDNRKSSTNSFGAAHSLAEAMLHLSGAALDEDLLENIKTRYPILNRMPDDVEGALTLCGAIECLSRPMVAFVRLAEGQRFKQCLEVPIPVRFVIVILTPKPSPYMDCHEAGRSISTLMSNELFHTDAYNFETKDELLKAINDFLDESIVLPPGNWDNSNLLNIQEIADIRRKKKERKEANQQIKKVESEKNMTKQEEAEKIPETEEKVYDPNDPMQRAPYCFGGMINDLKRRAPHYLSDFKDGLNAKALSSAAFIFFACLSGAIAFGGLMEEKTGGRIGITETLFVSSVSGVLFSLFAGMPLIITGVTGPVLLFDEALVGFADNYPTSIDYLPWRVWIGIWLVIIGLLVAMFQGSVMVRYFTKFTKDIFAGLVALLFIFEAFNKLAKIFKAHPLMSIKTLCSEFGIILAERLGSEKWSVIDVNETKEIYFNNSDDYKDAWTVVFGNVSDTEHNNLIKEDIIDEPNTALLSAFLMLATFIIAYYLKIFRNGKFLGRTVRRALGDFGVPIAILIMVLIDWSISDTYTEKLNVPAGLQVTNSSLRGWFISPISDPDRSPGAPGLAVWAPFVAVVPAFLLYVLLFMETHICELLMMERTNAKGAGVHWDIVLLCLLNCLGAFVGGPWICAATVRAVAHVSSLTIMSTNHAPGEQPHIVEVKDQRLSFFLVSLVLGFSVLLSTVLKLVPYAVLFGVFLYMGVSSINGIQLFDRVALLLKPVKYHPTVSYVRKVKTWKMHLFTVVQMCGLGILWAVKSSTIALAFPFFVVAMVPLRILLGYLPEPLKFTPQELEELDGKNAGKLIKDDEPDFYEQGHGG